MNIRDIYLCDTAIDKSHLQIFLRLKAWNFTCTIQDQRIAFSKFRFSAHFVLIFLHNAPVHLSVIDYRNVQRNRCQLSEDARYKHVKLNKENDK